MNLLAIAKAERDRLNKVIALLEAEATTPAPKPQPKLKPHANDWTDARRKAMSQKLRRVWAKKKKTASAKPPKQ